MATYPITIQDKVTSPITYPFHLGYIRQDIQGFIMTEVTGSTLDDDWYIIQNPIFS